MEKSHEEEKAGRTKEKEKKFKLSAEERAEYEEIYDLFVGEEKNISWREIGQVMAKLGIHCSREELEDMINVVDKDGYGLVHKKHFINLMTQKVKETRQENADEVYNEAFQIFDHAGNGMLTASDIRSIMLNIGEKVCDCEIEEMLKALQLDKTGISQEDFLKIVSGANM